MLKWILRLFKNNNTDSVNKTEPSNSGNSPSRSESSIKKIALIVGHGNGDSGAMGWNRFAEFDYNSIVAEEIANSETGKEVKVFYRGSSGIVGVAMKAVAYSPDLSMELHLNAFNGKAVGCEVLCLSGDEQSSSIGRSFASSFTQKFNRKLRREKGINWITKADRGYSSLKAVSSIKHSILVEPFFIDTKEEWIEPITYAEFLKEWIKSL